MAAYTQVPLHEYGTSRKAARICPTRHCGVLIILLMQMTLSFQADNTLLNRICP